MSLTLKLQRAAIAQEILAAVKTRVVKAERPAVDFHPAFIDQRHLEGRRVGPPALDQRSPVGEHPIVASGISHHLVVLDFPYSARLVHKTSRAGHIDLPGA